MEDRKISIELTAPQIGTTKHTMPEDANWVDIAYVFCSALGVFSVMFDDAETRRNFLRELGSTLTTLSHEVDE